MDYFQNFGMPNMDAFGLIPQNIAIPDINLNNFGIPDVNSWFRPQNAIEPAPSSPRSSTRRSSRRSHGRSSRRSHGRSSRRSRGRSASPPPPPSLGRDRGGSLSNPWGNPYTEEERERLRMNQMMWGIPYNINSNNRLSRARSVRNLSEVYEDEVPYTYADFDAMAKNIKNDNIGILDFEILNDHIRRHSLVDGFEINSAIFRTILERQNACVFPKSLQILVQESPAAEDSFNFNRALYSNDYGINWITGTIVGLLSFGNTDLFKLSRIMKRLDDFWDNYYESMDSCDKDFIIFPVELHKFNNFVIKSNFAVFIVNKKSGQGYFIDPLSYVKDKYLGKYSYRKELEYTLRKIEYMTSFATGIKIRAVQVQFLNAKIMSYFRNYDRYSMVWCYFITDMLIRNYTKYGKMNPKSLIQVFLRKYNSPKSLRDLVEKYGSYVKMIEEGYESGGFGKFISDRFQ
jgi:hypothetical protein